jgi:hypothetical protein
MKGMEMNIEHPTLNIEVEESEEFEPRMGRRVRGQRSLGKMKKRLLHRSWDILSQSVLGASCSMIPTW